MQFSTPLTKEEKRAHNEIAALLSGTPGCNCDRWGHPCPNCVERNVQPKAQLPISLPTKKMR